MNNRKRSIKMESLLVLLLAGGIAVGFFFLVNACGNFILDKYFQKSAFLEQANERCMDKFEKYVKQNNLSTSDITKIKAWEKKQKVVYIAVSMTDNHKILYDTIYDNLEEENIAFYKTGVNREIPFSDTMATVNIIGYFDYQFYVNSMVIEIILAVLLFVGIFIQFIEKKINYIIKLEKEINILETGGLDYKITIEGKDELASLAQGLNQMRITLLENMQKEEEAVQANYNLVVSIAHDLRTPLTALLLYLDLLQKGQYSEKAQLASYIEKSRTKAVQIKRMSDQLFERFLLSTEEKQYPATIQKAQYLFEDRLSDMICYLSEQQFKVETNINWPNVTVSLIFDYLGRILDNISSNIIKYAEIEKPIKIEILQRNEWLVLKFANVRATENEKIESTNVGVKNINIMMNKMGGNCKVHQTEQDYEVELCFIIIKKYE